VLSKFDTSSFTQIKITVGSGGVGGDSNAAGTGGGGFYNGGDGAQRTGLGGYHVASGGGGGATVVEGLSNGTTVPLAAAGGGGGGASWDTTTPGGIKNTAGGGGGAAGGVGGAAEGTFLGGGSDGSDAESSSGPVSNDIGGDGGSAGPQSAEPGGSGTTWVNDQYVTEIEEATPGGGGSGGSGGGTGGEDGADGSVNLLPQVVIESLSFPDSIAADENLTVEYTLTNTGETTGTESFVDLKVNGTNSTFDDSDTDVTVGPGELVNGTLTFDTVSQFFGDGDTIEFSVELWDFGDTESGQTDVGAAAEPDLVVESLDYPTAIQTGEDLEVGYTIENVGDADGTESAVDLVVNGTTEDSDTDVTVPAGETASGTLVFADSGEYGDGDSISFTVDLADFGDSASGETLVEDPGGGPTLLLTGLDAPTSIPVTADLTVEYTVENIGDEAGTESAVELLVDGTVEDTDADVTVGAGETASGTLTYDSVADNFARGGSVGFTVSLAEFGDTESGTTDILAEGEVNLAVQPSSVTVDPGETQTYEVVVEDPDGGILGYSDVVVTVDDPAVGNITGFDEQFNESDDAVFSNSEIQDGGSTLYLEAAAGEAFATPETETVLATFEVDAVGAEGETTDLSFDASAAQTVAEFDDGTAYDVNEYRSADLILDAGDGPNLVLTSVDAPAEVEPGADLNVSYTVENVGDAEGTESGVTLSVAGAEEDAATNVTLGPGESASGTLTFDGVDEYGPGDTIPWTVALEDFGDTESGETQIPGEPDLVIESLEYPDSVGLGDVLEVGYTVENAGTAEGTESEVAMVVAGATVDSDEDVTVPAGETASGTLVFPGVGNLLPGDVIEFTVELADFGDSENGSTTVEEVSSPDFAVDIVGTNDPVDAGQAVEVTANVSNVGDAEGTQSVELSIDGLGSDSTTVTLGAGDSTEETLTVGTAAGDDGSYTAAVTTANDSASTTVEVEDAGEAEFQVADVETNAPLVEGEDLEVTVTVENIGDAVGTQTVTVGAVDLEQVSAEFTLEAGNSAQKTLTLGTEIGDTGEHTLVVETEDHSMPVTMALHLPVMPGYESPPQDTNSDNLYEDVDSDGSFTIFDVQTFFNNFEHGAVQNHSWAYDYTGSGDVGIFDVQAMFNDLQS
jgi:hypothetical protein